MRTARQLETDAWQAIVHELGIADALRYRVLIDPRPGDYSREREAIFAGTSLDDCIALVHQVSDTKPAPKPRRGPAKARG
jgi:hypothetical protein